MKCWSDILFILLFIIPEQVLTRRCSRYPSNTFTPKSLVDENFVISITGNAQTFILGQTYNVSLHAYNGHRFVNAKLVLENENGEKILTEDLGRLEVVDPVETRYSPNCINMIESTNTNPKTRMDMIWVAPAEPGNGCVLIRATVLQHRDVWFMDDGGLTKRICEEVVDDVESQKKDDEEVQCCACDEARYEITFSGLWSRNLHPKDFPTRGWLTKFTDILGAAHTSDYRFWDMGVLATDEMKEFAEHGSTRGLEREFSQYFKEGKIRTIIKARGPAFPYLNNPTLASIRVDPKHHQLSLASKIVPSPDWIVGVAGLELCLDNCTWLEDKVINLYPWDIGTDAGPTYTSPDQPQFPADVIRRMRSDFPPDPRSPFFDESGAPMKPLATLTIKRQRLYERQCPDEESNNIQDLPRECLTHPWSSWSTCSAECGEGLQYRSRVYKQPDVADIYKCDVMVDNQQERTCQGENCRNQPNLYGGNPNNGQSQWQKENEEEEETFGDGLPQLPMKAAKTRAECLIKPWSSWSQCNETCGEGKMTRRREYLNPYNEDECQQTVLSNLLLDQISNKNNATKDLEKEIINNLNTNKDKFQKLFKYNFGYERKSETERSNTNTLKNVFKNEITDNLKTEKDSFQKLFKTYNLRHKRNGEAERSYRYENMDHVKNSNPSRHSNSVYDLQSPPNAFDYYNLRRKSEMNKVPEYCYHPLTITNCTDPQVIGNFWFYNYCKEECMLYASDICDINRNKFKTLKQCEENCARPVRTLERTFLKRKQAQECPKEPMKKVPDYCYHSLSITICTDPQVIRHFWFYNYCKEKCMLYATDICDINRNKFKTLKQCEQNCARPVQTLERTILKRKQAQGCQQGNTMKEVFPVKLYDYMDCYGKMCLGKISSAEKDDNNEFSNENNDNIEKEQEEEGGNEEEENQYGTLSKYNKHYRLKAEPEIRRGYNTRYPQQFNRFENSNKSPEGNVDDDEQPEEYDYMDNTQDSVNNIESDNLKQEESFEENLPHSNRYNNNNKRYQNYDLEDIHNIKPAYQRRDSPSSSSSSSSIAKNSYDKMQGYAKYGDSIFNKAPEYCYQSLNIIRNCADPRVIGNFWFYNYCTDECMLYAADICDYNRNKFLTLEQCEQHCAWPMRTIEKFLKYKQAQGCRGGQLQQTQQQQNERNFKRRKYY